MMKRRGWVAFAAAVVVLAGAGGVAVAMSRGYEIKVLMPTATSTFEGGAVKIRGERVGEITQIGVLGGKAVMTAAIDSAHAPLHAGTSARVRWASVVGSRYLDLVPGSVGNPELPSGKMINSTTERVELGDLFNTLDPPTRARLQDLVTQLNGTLAGREPDLNESLKTSGPTIEALGAVTRAVGDDGPAIRDLVQRLQAMTKSMADRHQDLGGTVDNLGQLTSATADKQQALKETLNQLPSTVDEATKTLGQVPSSVDSTVPLLRDLQPAAQRLPSVARNLSPVLTELRPTVAKLRPTLSAARSLLQRTPSLLDTAHDTVPGVTQALAKLQPAVTFLRPYTPELIGWLSNWASVFASQTSGNYARALIVASASSFNDNPGILPPGLNQDPRPAPGSNVGQSWTDANGDGMR